MMTVQSWVICGVLVLACVCSGVNALGQASLGVRIVSPRNGDRVYQRSVAEGTVSGSATVWIVVHPTDQDSYWVQPEVLVRADGTWRGEMYVGRPGHMDVGKRFDIRAVIADPNDNLREGMVLRKWPNARMRSEVVVVTRR